MQRKRLTQIFPFLIPIRVWQRKIFFYLKMYLDKNRYSSVLSKEKLPYLICKTDSLLINKNSGYDITYQYNKAHNLKLASKKIDGIIIKPGETFSFYRLVKNADKAEPYKDGLTLVDGKIRGVYGGGLCQLSNTLYWLMLHTPLKVTERHGHAVDAIPPSEPGLNTPKGIDATVSEGWLDLKVFNNTDTTYQIRTEFDDEYMHAYVLADKEQYLSYDIFNGYAGYYRRGEKIYLDSSVDRRITDLRTGVVETGHLYINTCEIGYKLSGDISIKEMGENI